MAKTEIIVSIKNLNDLTELKKEKLSIIVRDSNTNQMFGKDSDIRGKSTLSVESTSITAGNYPLEVTIISPGYTVEKITIPSPTKKTPVTHNVEVTLIPELANPVVIENPMDFFGEKEPIAVKLTPSGGESTSDQAFWRIINRDPSNDFTLYQDFINSVLSGIPKVPYRGTTAQNEMENDSQRTMMLGSDAYSLLKFATYKYIFHFYGLDKKKRNSRQLSQYFLGGNLPYIDTVEKSIEEFLEKHVDPNLKGNHLSVHNDVTLIELIWSYWMDEGKTEKSMMALLKRFQNVKNGYNDPLANFELDPLRPLNNILWGFINDLPFRLNPVRRNYEYEHQYGLRLAGLNPPGFNPADRRAKFLQSFHRLIYEATEYFVQSDNTIIRPDGFKLLNALRDTHRILAEGAHNQFGDLPTVARAEMLMSQWVLARPEIREFLGGRIMIPYEEPWMDRVDSMKALQGWDSTSVSFYRDLAVYGEKILLGIRFGNWSKVTNRSQATNWADTFRDAIQRYIHSYYTITGIDLSAQSVSVNSSESKYLMPGMLIQQKITSEKIIKR